MTKQNFREILRQPDLLFMNIVFKDGSEMEISREQLVYTDSDINRGYVYILDYDHSSFEEEVEVKISDIAEIIPLEDEDEEDWEDEYDEDDDWDDEDEDWEDEDDDWDDKL